MKISTSVLAFLCSTVTLAGAPVVWDGSCGSGIRNLFSNSCLSTGGGTVTSVTASAPIASSGGATPNITCPTASGSQAGCLAATAFTSFTGAATATTAATNSNTVSTIVKRDSSGNFSAGAVTLATPLSAASGGVGPSSKYLWVDPNRVDSYTPDGTIGKPFLTNAAALAQVVANGDNATITYVIVDAPGTYPTLVLEDAGLVSLSFIGSAGVTLAGVKSIANNDNLVALSIDGFSIHGDLPGTLTSGRSFYFTGASNGTNLCASGCLFSNNDITGIGDSFINVNFITFTGGSYFSGLPGIVYTNVSGIDVQSTGLFSAIGGTIALVSDGGQNKPSQFGGTFLLFEVGANVLAGSITYDAGSVYEDRSGARVQGDGDTMEGAGLNIEYVGNRKSNLTLDSGAEYDDYGVTRSGSVTDNSGGGWFVLGKQSLKYLALGAGMDQQTSVVLGLKDGHVKSLQTTAPTATVNANAGTSATCTVSHATDMSGQITLTTTAVSPSIGEQCKVNFNLAYNVAPICTVSPIDANAGLVNATSHAYFAATTSVVAIDYGVVDAAGHVSNWAYHCIETQ